MKKSNVFQKQRCKLSKYVGNANGVFLFIDYDNLTIRASNGFYYVFSV